ncbi:MAG: hypothetical protein RLP44_26900 [Aggregatilineales bacterium]
MLRFFRNISLLVFVVSLLLIYSAIASGSFRHDPLKSFFTNPDGSRCEMPCLLGIRAGETTFEEAITLVQNHPLTHNLRFFEGDYGFGLPSGLGATSQWILFAGQNGNAVGLQIFGRWGYSSDLQDGVDYHNPVDAVCIKSAFNNGRIELPLINSELTAIWHDASFLQMITTLGTPQSISSPVIAGTRVAFGSTRLESFYFDEHLVITHTSDTSQPPDFFHNFFDTLCIYAYPNLFIRFMTGFHGRTGAIVPWLGLNASIQDYYDWIADNPATQRVQVWR